MLKEVRQADIRQKLGKGGSPLPEKVNTNTELVYQMYVALEAEMVSRRWLISGVD
jgi:hypothetical protein